MGFALAGSVTNWAAFAHPIWCVVGRLVGYPLVLVIVWVILGGGTAAGEDTATA